MGRISSFTGPRENADPLPIDLSGLPSRTFNCCRRPEFTAPPGERCWESGNVW